MVWETVGFLLTTILTGIFLLFKIKKDVFPYALKKWMNRLALSNWQKSLPQRIKVFDTFSPEVTEETGMLPNTSEYELEKPEEINQPGDADDLSFYGIDDEGNALVTKISKLWKGWTEVSLCLTVKGDTYTVCYDGPASNPDEFSLGNFKVEMVEPFRAWRLWFNGAMQKVGEDNNLEVELVHVTLNFLWKSLDNPSDFQKNANLDLLSEWISDNGAFGTNLADLKTILPPGYLQFGSFHGNVKVDGIDLDEFYLYGHRLRRYLKPTRAIGASGSRNLNHHHFDKQDHLELFGMCGTNGNAFRLMGFNGDWVDGQILYSSFQVKPIRDIDVPARSFKRDLSLPKLFRISDSKSSQTIEIWPKYQTLHSSSSSSLEVILLKLSINGKSGRGLLIRKLDNISTRSLALLDNPVYHDLITKSRKNDEIKDNIGVKEDGLDFLDFCSDSCQSVSLVGGKGASLAKLAKFCGERGSEFKTAKGFCVTTKLFRKMVDLQKLKDVFSKDDCQLEGMCSEAIELIKSTRVEVEAELEKLIQPEIGKAFGSNVRFAVRSSGVLEDGSDLSCAGQNETFLGVDKGSIPSKIIDCWASLFTFQSVGYRLNHGQPAVSEMGVVVQEMVNATSAGVLFTADPRTGNPFQFVLTANYGLGESVVSASCDPDTMILLRSRQQSKSSLTVGDKTLGDKKTRIILSSDGKSTEECVTKDGEAQVFCLQDDKALELGQIGLKIEKEMGQLKPVDIEWALSQTGEIYILQCRAMTSLDAWTDFEIIHQFDSSIRTPIDRMTTANAGEVMPKPIHPISVQIISRGLDVTAQIIGSLKTGDTMCPLMSRCTPMFQQRLHLNMYQILYRFVDEKLTPEIGCVDLAVFGRSIIDKEMHGIALERHGATSAKLKINSIIHAFKSIRRSSKEIKLGEEKFGKLKLDYSCVPQTAKTVYDKITKDLILLAQAGRLHIFQSEVSSTTMVFAFLAVAGGRDVNEWTSSLFEDTGLILSVNSAVESAEMPVDIEELGESIVKLGKNHQDFLKLTDTNEAISWLRSHEGLGKALDKFLEKHGHRGISEMDVGTKSWRTDPTPLVNLLKNIVKNKLEAKDESSSSSHLKKNLTTTEVIDSLKAPLSKGVRLFLKFLLPYSRDAVMNRERSKSLYVRTIDQFKQAYYHLGRLMVKERLIADENLLKHLTHSELGILINKEPTSSTILYKAMRRMKLYPSLEKLEFPEISLGIPKPVNNLMSVELTDVIKGTPVSSGKVQGVAKVCLSVEEASELIRPGDILITKGTDIAWSPFFPILGGVVTELGGLISHGAVVAREYGLPCIVGAVNATKIFKTGDQVILDTSTGTLAKVKESE